MCSEHIYEQAGSWRWGYPDRGKKAPTRMKTADTVMAMAVCTLNNMMTVQTIDLDCKIADLSTVYPACTLLQHASED